MDLPFSGIEKTKGRVALGGWIKISKKLELLSLKYFFSYSSADAE